MFRIIAGSAVAGSNAISALVAAIAGQPWLVAANVACAVALLAWAIHDARRLTA